MTDNARQQALLSVGLSAMLSSAPVIGLLVAWEAAARFGVFSAFLLPALSDVLLRIGTDMMEGELLTQIGLTLYRALAGFMLAAMVGILVGILMARNRAIDWFFNPIVSLGFPAPKVAFLPIFILWFGLFDLSKILMTVFAVVFPIIVATEAGTRGVDRFLVWSARNTGAGEAEILLRIILPAALPQIFTGLQIALPISLIITIVSEMVMGGEGLGGAMISASRFADSVGVFAGIVEIAVSGYLLIKAMELIRRRLLVWHQETQQISTF